MNIVYRFRIYPNKSQKELFARTFGCVRFVYNRMLAEKKEYYEKTGKVLKVTPAKYKAEFPWLKEVDSLDYEECNVIEEALSAISDMKTQLMNLKGAKKCPNCGAEVAEDASFCASCGTKLDDFFED